MREPHHILLTLLSGASHVSERKLMWGVAVPRLSLGTAADWVIRGAGIQPLHLILSFDGRRLRGAAGSSGAQSRVHGAELDARGLALELPFELSFGSARLAAHVVGSPGRRALAAPPARVPGPQGPHPWLDRARLDGLKTQVFDASALLETARASHALLRLEQEPPTFPANPLPFQIVSRSTLIWPLAEPRPELLHPVPPSRKARTTSTRGAGLPTRAAAARPALRESRALTETVSDGGALRAYARQLAQVDFKRARVGEPLGALPRRAAAVARQLRVAHRALSQACARARAVVASLPRQQRLLIWPVLGSLGLLVCVAGMASPAAPLSVTPEGAPPPAVSAQVRAGATPGEVDSRPSVDAPGRPPAAAVHSALAAPVQGGLAPGSTSLQQAAFRAAFGGSISQGVALYQELAQRGGGPVFAEAARLLQSGHVQKP
jgi:hypothetical protein